MSPKKLAAYSCRLFLQAVFFLGFVLDLLLSTLVRPDGGSFCL